MDDMFGMEAVDKSCEALPLDATDGQDQCLYLRRRDGQEGIERHYRATVIPTLSFSSSTTTKATCTCRDVWGPSLDQAHRVSKTICARAARGQVDRLPSPMLGVVAGVFRGRSRIRKLRAMRLEISHEIVHVASSTL